MGVGLLPPPRLTVDSDGGAEEVLSVEGQPSGLGWMPDGSLLVVSMRDHRILRRAADGDGRPSTPTSASTAPGTSTTWSSTATAARTPGTSASTSMAGADPAPAALIRVDPDGTASVAAEDLLFPNGP